MFVIALVAATTLAPRRVAAAACCTSATSFGVGRLLVWEDWAVGLQVGHARSLGQWDATGSLRRNPSGFSDGLTRMEPWAILRLHERIQLQAWAPFVVNDRHSGGQSQVATGLGDVGGAVRYELAGIGEYAGLPSFAVTAGVVAPTGRRVEETSGPLFAGATGRDAWGGSLALEAEYAWLPWFVRLNAGATAFLPFHRADTGARQNYGQLVQVSLSTGRELVPDVLVAALAVQGEWEGAQHISGEALPGSSASLYSLAGSLSWRVDPHWSVVGIVTNTVWPDGAGENRDARIGFTIGVRHGHF